MRTFVVTGAASGIGAATTAYLRGRGDRVITSDLHDADVVCDLATKSGRAELVEGVKRHCGGALDAIVANAGGGPPETMLALNFFGTIATVDGLRPLLLDSAAPRAIVVSSVAALGPFEQTVVDACLCMDEAAAIAVGEAAIADGKAGALYGSAKHALNRWCRRAAIGEEWAGAGIPLNVIAPGIVDTPAAAYILSNPELAAQMYRMVPMAACRPGRPEQLAAIIAWCTSAENALMTGQILFVDGGLECAALGDAAW